MCISGSFIRLDFIYDLFEKVGSRNNEEKMGTARRKPTVSSQFRVSGTYHRECARRLIHHTLTSLIQVASKFLKSNTSLNVLFSFQGLPPCSHGHSQCVQPFLHPLHKAQHEKGLLGPASPAITWSTSTKPNMRYLASLYLQNPTVFDPEVVLNQLRYSGMLETVKIRRAGFPVRRTFKDFFSRLASLISKCFNHGCCSCSFVVLNIFSSLSDIRLLWKTESQQ